MKNDLDKRLQQYRKVLQKAPMLYEIAEELYKEDLRLHTPWGITTLFVMAPVMMWYVCWVLQEALAAGKKRLYFLARDGYSMYQTAKVFCERMGLPVECRYLYCSRYALRSAEYAMLKEESLSYICLGGIDVTFEKVMHRAGLSGDETDRVAKLLGYLGRTKQPLSWQEVKGLAPGLAACPQFMDAMLAHAKEKYPAVCGYLKQEGLCEDISYGIVDSGWMGSMQKSLKNLLDSMGYQREPEGYYFGMYEYPENVEKDTYHFWYFGPEEEIRRKVYFSNSLFECIFSSPEGMTLAYEKKDGIWEPVLEKKDNPNRGKIEKSTECLRRYAERLTTAFPKEILKPASEGRLLAAQLLYLFMGKPTLAEASAFGTYIFCDDVIGEAGQTVAAPLSRKDLKENHLSVKGVNTLLGKDKPVHESAWPEASSVLQKNAGKLELLHCALYKYVLYLRKLVR